MNRPTQSTQLKTACWIAVGSFTATSIGFGWSMHQLFTRSAQPGSLGLMCGNSVTDPLGVILSFGPPISFAGVAGFVFLWRRGVAGWTPLILSLVLTLACTAGLLSFGFQFYREALHGFHLSEIVWWLKPFGV